MEKVIIKNIQGEVIRSVAKAEEMAQWVRSSKQADLSSNLHPGRN